MLVTLFASVASADIVTTLVNPANGNTYHLLTESTWTAAQAEAITLGGNLITINDSAEQAWVFSSFGSFGGTDRSLWIGLNDISQEGNFTWVSGETVSYTNWFPGQPDSSPTGGDEDYVHMQRTGNLFGNTPGTWNDLANSSAFFPQFGPIHGVVEITAVPEPSSLALLAVSTVLFWKARRSRAVQ